MADRASVTVVWASAAPPVRDPSDETRVTLEVIAPDALPVALPALASRGAVVAIVDDDKSAHRALSLGADEVLRAETMDRRALDAAIERSRVRASLRGVARVAIPSELQDKAAMELLADAIGYHLKSPLAAAAFSCEVLRAAMGPVTGLADGFARTAAHGTVLPRSERDRVVALRATAPTSRDRKSVV